MKANFGRATFLVTADCIGGRACIASERRDDHGIQVQQIAVATSLEARKDTDASNRGFGWMDDDKQRESASKCGRSVKLARLQCGLAGG